MKTSEKSGDLFKAFIKFQSEVKQPKKNAINPHFRSNYSTLDEIIRTVTPILTAHGLAVIQEVTGDGATVTVITRIIHESGEWLETDPLTLKCEKTTPQGQGSAASYGRRYALSAVLGISSEDDDDGNQASGMGKKHPIKAATSTPKNDSKMTATEWQSFWKNIENLGKTKEDVLKKAGVSEEEFKNWTRGKVVELFTKIRKEVA